MTGSTTHGGRSRGADPRTDRLRRLALHLLTEVEDLSATVARVLHDDIGQALAATNLGLFRLSRRLRDDPEADELIAVLRRELTLAGQSAHRLRAGLRLPAAVRDRRLDEVVAAEIERCRIELGIDIEACVTVGARRPGRLGTALVSRLVRLAIAEAVRRTRARRLRIRIAAAGTGHLALSFGTAGHAVREPGGDRAEGTDGELRDWIDLLGGRLLRPRAGHADDLLRMRVPISD